MSLYADYIREKTQGDVVEIDGVGFASYVILEDKTCYIKEIYVIPKERCHGVASDMADSIEKVAREKGCTALLGSVVPSAKDSTSSLSVLIAYGFRLQSSSNDFIFFRKEIT